MSLGMFVNDLWTMDDCVVCDDYVDIIFEHVDLDYYAT